MDLRTGQPVWLQDDGLRLEFPRLKRGVSCDVIVIGAGITGALVTHQLLAAGMNVVVIDKRRIARGSTAASTGLLLYQTDASLSRLTELHDARTANRVFKLGRRAVRQLGKLVEELSQESGYGKRPTLYVASERKDVAPLRSEKRALCEIDLPAKFLNGPKLERDYGIAKPAALASSGAAEVNAFQLTRAVFRHHRKSKNLRVFEKTTVNQVKETSDGVSARLSSGASLRAKFLVVAAGYESQRFGQSELVKLHSTYVIASRPFPPHTLWKDRALMWETARPYFYLRSTPDNRIVFGGRDEPFQDAKRRDHLLPRKTRELEEQFAQLFPHLAFKAEFAWTGTFAETTDGLPCIGRKKGNKRIVFALGYGGNGITFSQMAAQMIRDICLGKRNPDLKLFSFDRLPRKRPR